MDRETNDSIHHSPVIHSGRAELDPSSGQYYHQDGKSAQLTFNETRLLSFLMVNPGHCFSADYLIEELWKSNQFDPAGVRVIVNRIRNKIEPYPASPCYLVNRFGYGYEWKGNIDAPVDASPAADRADWCSFD